MRLNFRIWNLRFFVVTIAAVLSSSIAVAEPKVREINDFPPTKPAEGEALTDGIPHGRAAHGAGKFFAIGVLKAWFAIPTDRYRHGVLGDRIEAGGVMFQPPSPDTPSAFLIKVPEDSVFEDNQPRIVDFDGDGILDIVAIRSYLDAGASVSVIGYHEAKDGAISSFWMQSPPIGTPNRWLNPVGVADFDGDGDKEIVAVVTPHIGGVLTVYKRDGEKLVPKPVMQDVSNHMIGSPDLRLHAVIDWNDDGVPDIAVPDQSHRVLRFITLKDGVAKEIDRVDLGAEMIPPMKQRQWKSEPWEIIVRLKDGRAVAVAR
ncbi:VCBS repeat-containing protein [Alphaproteobacteria bacterium]|nr:VCBS repeat-containing protein [Alphaproteobacteria bacterium]